MNAVLDAMREQKARRSSFPAAAEVAPPPEPIDADATNELPARRRRTPVSSDAFLKAR